MPRVSRLSFHYRSDKIILTDAFLLNPCLQSSISDCSTLSYPVTSLRASSHRHDILLSSAEEEGEDLEISEVLVHPLYDAYRIDYDVALWKLKAPATTGNIVPFVDTKGSYSRTGTDAISIGWGATREGGAGSTVLREVTVPILDQSECNSKYYIGQITERMTCAGMSPGHIPCFLCFCGSTKCSAFVSEHLDGIRSSFADLLPSPHFLLLSFMRL
jgi:hypothetical protein